MEEVKNEEEDDRKNAKRDGVLVSKRWRKRMRSRSPSGRKERRK